MSESDNEFYTIPSYVMDTKITFDDLDTILDKHINADPVSEKEEITVIMYIFQLMYRSGHRGTCTKDIHDKYELLVNDRLLDMLKKDDIIEEYFDASSLEPVYELKNILPTSGQYD